MSTTYSRLRRLTRPLPYPVYMGQFYRVEIKALLDDLDSAEESLGESQEIVAELLAEIERQKQLVRIWSHPWPFTVHT